MRINEDRGKSRNSKATLSIYKGISKGLGRIFKRFREIRQNSTEDQGINKYLSPTLSPTLSKDLFCWQAILSISPTLSLTLSEDLFFIEIAIWSHPQTHFPLPISPINT